MGSNCWPFSFANTTWRPLPTSPFSPLNPPTSAHSPVLPPLQFTCPTTPRLLILLLPFIPFTPFLFHFTNIDLSLRIHHSCSVYLWCLPLHTHRVIPEWVNRVNWGWPPGLEEAMLSFHVKAIWRLIGWLQCSPLPKRLPCAAVIALSCTLTHIHTLQHAHTYIQANTHTHSYSQMT